MTAWQNIGTSSFTPNTQEGDSSVNLKAAIYARTSSASQRFGYSIDEQIRQCWERCERLGWTVTYVFKDDAVSGKDTDRPMFQQLIRCAKLAAIDIVVFWKLDRFSRSLIHAVQLEKEFREYGVALHSVTEQIDTTTPTGRFNFRNISSASEFERELIRQRSRMGMKALALAHKWPNSQPPYGYIKTAEGGLTENESESEILERTFKDYTELKSMAKVSTLLNQIGAQKRNSKSWSVNDVSRLLRNEIYIGQYNVAGVSEHVEEYQIIDKDLFDAATAVRTRFKRSSVSREEMEYRRKNKRVKRVTDQYQSYVEK